MIDDATPLLIKRWLRALDIAKILFEEEGYHTLYLEQIESLIRRQTMTNGAQLVSKGCTLVTREQLATLPTPKGTATWSPVAHADLVDALHGELDSRHITVRNETYAVQSQGNVLYGTLDIDWMDDGESCASVGLRTSNNKVRSLQIAVGQRIFLCSNGVFSSDLIPLRRKHTSRLNIIHEMREAFDRYQDQYHRLLDDVGVWKYRDLTESEAKESLYDIFEAGILPLRLLKPVNETYFCNGYTKTAWGLLNSCTEHVKSLHPAPQFEAHTKLSRYFERRY